ncbi:MAG TPA: class II glutamine amidotransferase [Solirubrobacter sp.]|nr:class II glutamine amidotransferase [Solirubrobacter sp.]
MFGLTGGREPVTATFWLIEAPDSLAVQSRRNPDGYGLATFDADGSPRVDKGPVAAWRDMRFAQLARETRSTTFVAHVRFASTGPMTHENTHPFEQDGRIFAHNGLVAGLEQLELELGRHRDLVSGDTDSERLFTLITRRIHAAGGDVRRGIVSAVRWVAEELPVYSMNFILATPRELFALRYPDVNPLFVLERDAGGPSGFRQLAHSSAGGTVRVRSDELRVRPSVVIASEPMDEDAGWRQVEPGQLIHVDANLNVSAEMILPDPPAHQLALEDLDVRAAASQTEAGDSQRQSRPAEPLAA